MLPWPRCQRLSQMELCVFATSVGMCGCCSYPLCLNDIVPTETCMQSHNLKKNEKPVCWVTQHLCDGIEFLPVIKGGSMIVVLRMVLIDYTTVSLSFFRLYNFWFIEHLVRKHRWPVQICLNHRWPVQICLNHRWPVQICHDHRWPVQICHGKFFCGRSFLFQLYSFNKQHSLVLVWDCETTVGYMKWHDNSLVLVYHWFIYLLLCAFNPIIL